VTAEGNRIKFRERKIKFPLDEKKMIKGNRLTQIEILVVVIVLCVVAAIVIPQFSAAGEEAKLSMLVSDLQTIRSQIQLYKLQHNSELPTKNGVTFEKAMTKYTKADGTPAKPQAPGDGIYGPYLHMIPKNAFNNSNVISTGAGAPPGDNSSGWYFNVTTGAFNANDSAVHVAL
jgi:general secretion pathway protein G